MHQHPGTSPRRAHIVVVGILDLKMKNLEAALAPLRAHHARQATVSGAQHLPSLKLPHRHVLAARRHEEGMLGGARDRGGFGSGGGGGVSDSERLPADLAVEIANSDALPTRPTSRDRQLRRLSCRSCCRDHQLRCLTCQTDVSRTPTKVAYLPIWLSRSPTQKPYLPD